MPLYLYIYENQKKEIVCHLLKYMRYDNLKVGEYGSNGWKLLSVQVISGEKIVSINDYHNILHENRRKRYTKRGRLKWKHRKWFN